MHQIRRIGDTFYARLTVPRDRWEDAGKATGAKNGQRREVVRTLNTKDRREALKRRAKAVEEMRQALNAQLSAAGLRPLEEGWVPSWQAEALVVREEIRKASDERRPGTHPDHELPSIQDAKLAVAFDRAEELEDRLGKKVSRAYLDIVTASITPIRITADRWLRDISGTIRKQTAGQHERSLALLGRVDGFDQDHGAGESDDCAVAVCGFLAS